MFSKCCWCRSKSSTDQMPTDADKSEKAKAANELPILDNVISNEIKPNSNSSESRPEPGSDNDDEVFCEGVGPTAKLAENLGTCKGHTPLPRWFRESSEGETVDSEAPATPPATPVGKDELALRRHRLFSEIIDLTQHAAEHKVKFDPFGPVVAGGSDDNCLRSDLEDLIFRLETVTTRLEKVCLPIEQLLNLKKISSPEEPNMSVQGFSDIIQGPLTQYLQISQQIGGDVGQHSQLVHNAFQMQLQYLVLASQSKQPSQNEIISLLKPTSDQISAIQDFREKHRTSQFFNHLSAISESIPALGWVTVSPAPAPYVKEMNDAGQFYTNRVLKDWKEKDKRHVDWVKAWIQTLVDLQAFVKQQHTTGLVWAGKGSAAPPPPPPGCPPPPPVLDFAAAEVAGGDADRSALFAQINQGENITRSLKKVTADMQTHKNPTLREGPAPFKTPARGAQGAPAPVVDKPPSFARDGKKWLIEYQKGNHNLVVENVEMNNVVYLFKCTDSTVVVKGKLNSITLDSCKKTSIVFDSLVSAMEFINCQSVQMQVLGKVPTISIDKTDGCQMYLSPESLDVEIVSSKSSEMNVLVPKGNGDYTEYPIPEQYKTTVVPGKGLSTIIVENKG
ncbi:adenylyl cyclase-associated protein 1 isoform X1 [Tribolium castaneum]|uniref:adenylyl cyclase-associated protein 1 isoform X1 n=1 Tax=Tribolium castaneum TaxID=7070 RepID=UPI00046C16CF|nr:PREDICTED: adenylyl cyclase-associated protein 1 isoform X1 [Tribolium castaneum]|eukprot:XP_008200251.1 PREDICTED: adenylyl cyclase-associated protein 1 isoform X1 [Tribolium castaneum]